MSTTHTTKHTHPVVFGRKVNGCPRCAELLSGAAPIRWNVRRDDDDARHVAEIRAHDCKASHCGIICTFGEW